MRIRRWTGRPSCRLDEHGGKGHGMGAYVHADDIGLIGRAHEQEQVAALLTGLSGGGSVLHLSGGPGTGKSAVIRYAAVTGVAHGMHVLSTRSAPSEQGLRHAALHSLLLPGLERLTELPAGDRAALDAAFGGRAEPAPAQLAAAALRLLALTPGPVLVCVDDLDLLDSASQDTLREMTRLCGRTRVGLIVAERAEPGTWLARDALTLALGPLPDAEARELVRRAGRTTGRAEEEIVLAVSEGNPLALTELSLGDGTPGDAAAFGMLPATPCLAEAYAEDLKGLSVSAGRMLLTAALSVSSLVQDVLDAGTRLAGAGSGSADGARAGLAEVVARGLVVVDGYQLRFPQPLVRVAVLNLEPAARRMAVHAALGQTVAYPPHAAWHAGQCAAGADEELAERLDALAAESRSGTGVLTALAALECAARLSAGPMQRAARLLRAVELACDHGLRGQALRYARGLEPAELGAYGRALLLWVYDLLPGISVVGPDRIVELCEAARAVASEDPALAQKLLLAAARRCWWQQAGPGERCLVSRTLEEFRPWPRDASDLAVMVLTDPRSAIREPLHSTSGQSRPEDRSLLGEVAHLTGDLDQAALLLEEAETAIRSDGRYGRLPSILVPRALGEIWLGSEWETAQTIAEEGRAIAIETGQPEWAARGTGTQGVIEALRGHHDRALECAAEAEEASLRLGQRRQLTLAVLARALTASGTGRYGEAYAQLSPMFTELTAPCSFEQLSALIFLVEAALPAAELDGVRAVVERIEGRTRTRQTPLLQGALAFAHAVLAPEDEAESRYGVALGPGAEVWPFLHGMTQFSYGVWLRRRRRVLDSREPLAAAESVFRALGARPRADQAAAELRATGWTAPDTTGEDLSRTLSPQQITIARLAAQGMSNRSIGEQLRLSPRTVSGHLYRIFPKLDVTSRAQLAARFETF